MLIYINIKFTEKDVVRHRLVQQIIKAYEKHYENKKEIKHEKNSLSRLYGASDHGQCLGVSAQALGGRYVSARRKRT